MDTSIVYSVLLFILCFNFSKTDSLRELCETFKPNGTFDGIKVYNKYIESDSNDSQKLFKHFMYKNGKEWEFVLDIDEETFKFELTFIGDTFMSIGRPVMHPFTYNKFEFDIIKERDKILITENGLKNQSLKVNSKLVEFILKIPENLRGYLEGIVEVNVNISNKRGWLLLFKVNSKPLFCFTRKTLIYPEQCKEENLLKYGQECDNYTDHINVSIHNLSMAEASPRKGIIAFIGSPEQGTFWFFLALSIGVSCCCYLCKSEEEEETGPNEQVPNNISDDDDV